MVGTSVMKELIYLPRSFAYFVQESTLVLIVCYYHVTYEFQSESRLYSLPGYQGIPCSKQA